MTSHRSAITGEFVTAEYAKSNPDTTVSEKQTRRPARDYADLRARAEACPPEDVNTEWYSEDQLGDAIVTDDRPFIAACSPTVILGLLGELDRLRGVNHSLQVALYGANVKIVELEANLDHLVREVRAAVHPDDDHEGGCEPDLEPEPACLIHDTSGEDVRGWEMAECTCPRRSGHDGDDDANSNSKAQLGVGLEPIAFDPPLTDDEAGAFLDAITTDEADQ